MLLLLELLAPPLLLLLWRISACLLLAVPALLLLLVVALPGCVPLAPGPCCCCGVLPTASWHQLRADMASADLRRCWPGTAGSSSSLPPQPGIAAAAAAAAVTAAVPLLAVDSIACHGPSCFKTLQLLRPMRDSTPRGLPYALSHVLPQSQCVPRLRLEHIRAGTAEQKAHPAR
jgi:hypothetical protein